MSGRRAIWEVARRELVERSRSRVMRISVVLVLVLAVGGAIAAAQVGQADAHRRVGLVGSRAAATAPGAASLGPSGRPPHPRSSAWAMWRSPRAPWTTAAWTWCWSTERG